MNPLRDNPFNERLALGVQRIGFRKWYERELLSGHAHLVLTLLASVGLMASMEAFQGGLSGEKLVNVAFVLLCAAIGLWSLRRYLYLLMHAEEIANQANCPSCNAYGRLTVVHENRHLSTVRVCCKKCQHEWDIIG